MIPVWDHRGSMAVDVDDSSSDLSDSSETIREHVRDSVHQPSFYMLPDLSDVLCSEDDDAVSSFNEGMHGGSQHKGTPL